MEISRKDWLAEKYNSEKNKKILQSARKMRKGFAVISASVLVSSFLASAKEVQAEEKTEAAQRKPEKTAEHPFLSSIVPSASLIAQKNDLYASVMMAQAILESGWGTSQLASVPNHNLFGIKGDYQGSSVKMDTLEDSGNQNYYQIQANFRKYPSYKESLEDYASLLRSGTSWDPNFYSGTWKSNAATYQDATASLTGRYATDTAYDAKLNRIIETHQLSVYDTPSPESPQVSPGEPVLPEAKPTDKNDRYTVQAGDTLYAISRNYQISVADLMAWNNLKDSLLHPGDVLFVQEKEAAEPEAEKRPAANEEGQVGSSVYSVKPGDSLWKISQKFGVTVSQLKQWNSLKSEVIQPGQELIFAAGSQNKPEELGKTEDLREPESIQNSSVTVSAGDTLYKIAAQAGVTAADLKEWNQLKSDLIYPGQKLVTAGEKKEENPPAPPAAEEDKKEILESNLYTVVSGDTLYRIASKNNVSVEQLKEWNALNSDLLSIGQKLELQKKTLVPVEESGNSADYIVQKGDTLYAISKKHNISVAELMEKNHITSNLIQVGQQLKVK